ncbi:MAG: hypothetical protein WC916_04470 [Candidatus Woesearchaeota archaeon]
MTNLLIRFKIRKIIKKKHFKANDETIKEIEIIIAKEINNLINTAARISEIKGKKVITKEEITQAIKKIRN